ncbi:fucolectin-like [Megalobrama amblycephala]|uniref:fucolectin-like n=1 Tax=Megalobrama amblycephala TaxID=75352 RepID=UPI00201459EE|nr:fucolectin-like [Megalobrama amblycephala]
MHVMQLKKKFLGNLAAGEAVTQSSTSADWSAEKAIDGNRGLQQLYTGCSSTLNETNPWWRLDLRHVYRVSRVVITNRKDCCAERLNGAEIHIGHSLENNGSNNPICAVIPAIPAGESYSYSCNGMDGRYVNLIIPGDMKIFALCEVEIYGDGKTLSHIFVNKYTNKTKTFNECNLYYFISHVSMCFCLGPVIKRSFVKMQFNSGVDLTDPSMRENVLKQVRERNRFKPRDYCCKIPAAVVCFPSL